MNSRERKSECPLILPDGHVMKPDEFFAGRYKQFDLEDNPEVVDENLQKICLNDTEKEFDPKSNIDSDPEKLARTVLENLVNQLRTKNEYEINHYDALSLSYTQEVQQIFRETALLKYIDLNKLETAEQATCFLVNLTNLMWIHALFSVAENSEDLKNGLIYKNWSLRHIYYNMFGYMVNGLGFVTLYDLHSSLLQYPYIIRSEILGSIGFLEDDRIDFVLAQPYIFSPKVAVLNPENLDKQLTELKNQYMKMCLIIESHIDLLVPVPLLMHMERISYDPNAQSENVSSEDVIPEKLNLLVEILREEEIPYYELITKEIYMINDTQFKIRLGYNIYEKQTLTASQKITWKCCKYHRSLYYCLQDQVMLLRSTTLNEHTVRTLCRCNGKSNICINNTLLRLNETYDPLLNEYHVKTNFDNIGVRCLHSSIVFAIGIRKKRNKVKLTDTRYNFQYMLKIIEHFYLKMPTTDICRKINISLKIFSKLTGIHEKWPHWYNIYIADPSDVLNSIVATEDVDLAFKFITVQLAVDSNYAFNLEVYSKYVSLLSTKNDANNLKKALEHLNGLKITDICDFLLKNNCALSGLITLVSFLIETNHLSSMEKMKMYSLLVGLKLINAMPKHEQMFCLQIVHNPLLVVEQQILNKKMFSIKTALKEVTPFITSLPEDVQQMEAISRTEIDELIRSYASKTLHFCKKPTSENRKYAAVLHSVIFKDENFHPPDEVPPMQLWVPNNWVTNCMCCKTTVFSVFVRRHHCRRCGRIVCDTCSLKRMKVETYKTPVRVCIQCYEFEKQYENSEESSLGGDTSLLSEESMKKPVWKLSENNELNDVVRQQATFDTAPDIELCLAILELHSENIAVPRFLFNHAENMIKILRQRLVCPANFDYSEVSHIVRSLLLAAKVYYTHLGETHGIRRCEEFTSEMDILNQLAKIKFLPIEPSKPIRDIQGLQRIRDTLLEKQQWDLALEISTKIGLECNSIWYVWGKTCLKAGDWCNARDKFSRSSLKKNSAMLDDVLEILCSNMETGSPKGLAKFLKSAPKKPSLPDNVFNECLHYLHNYGTGKQIFEFYVKYKHITDAIKVAFSRRVSPKLFLQKIYVPHLKAGVHQKILTIMKSLDDTLLQWKDYIQEMCIYCNDNKYSKELYEIQLWMKDHFRAAISCTMFYKATANTYAQLAKNEEHIQNAILHLQACLNQSQGDKLVKVIDPKAIFKCLSTANLQLEITKIIVKNSSCANMKFETVPTLFNNEEEKINLIVLVAEAMDNIKESSRLIDKCINEYSLNAVLVYSKVATKLMQIKQENSVIALVACIKETVSDPAKIVDAIAVAAVKEKPQRMELFLSYITEITTKLEMHIEAGWLKTAYMLSVKYKKLEYVEKIMGEAKRLNMTAIERICARKLGINY